MPRRDDGPAFGHVFGTVRSRLHNGSSQPLNFRELAEYLTSSERDGLAPGSQGWWDDNCILRPWGFDLADITVPVLLLHDRQDMFVPLSHGGWLTAHIPGVEARLLDSVTACCLP